MMKLSLVSLIAALALASPVLADDTDFTGIGQPTGETSSKNDSCRYVDVAYVVSLVGEKVIAPPFDIASAGPDPAGSTCRLAFQGFRSLDIDVSQKGGDKLFELLTGITVSIDEKSEHQTKLNHILGVDGDWDEVRISGRNKILALQDDRLVVLTVSGLALAEETAVKILRKSYDQLDHPQGPNGANGIAAGKALEAKRPKPRDACELADFEKLSAALGISIRASESHGASCDVSFILKGSLSYKIVWKGGWQEMDMLAGVMGSHLVTGILPAADLAKLQVEGRSVLADTWLKQDRAVSSPSWDAGFGGFALQGAVKHDVFVLISNPNSAFTPAQEMNALKVLTDQIP